MKTARGRVYSAVLELSPHNMKLLLAFVCSVLVASGDGHVQTMGPSLGYDSLHYTCPDLELIRPCRCYLGNLDCSYVESEEQLAHIMASLSPELQFHCLTIENNQKLRVLKAGTLAGTAFNLLIIRGNVLETVESGALSSSSSVASYIDMSDNQISSFPWDDLSQYTQLSTLYLMRNNISYFPSFTSDTLYFLDLSSNPLGQLPSWTFDSMPNLWLIDFSNTGLKDISPGTFVGLSSLKFLYLNDNDLVHLPSGVIEVNSSYCLVSLTRSNISSVAVNAISGFDDNSFSGLFFDYNQLTVLEEEVWWPLLEKNVTFNVIGNPILCDCSIAWLVLNPNFLYLLEENTECSSGEVLVDLDPDIFEQC